MDSEINVLQFSSGRIVFCIMILIGTLPLTTAVQDMGKGFAFKTCMNSGPRGPTQYQCDNAYKQTQVNVTVLDSQSDPPLPGVQVWIVPEDNEYSITALGASGGTGVRNPTVSKGAYAHAKFNFTKGEKIYLLVGQSGSSACPQSKNTIIEQICRNGTMSKETENIFGGGGGGGATFVFKINDVTKEVMPLLVAGGGGGKSFMEGKSVIKADGGLGSEGNSFGANTTLNGPGGGGGWNGLGNPLPQAGRSPLQGGEGGGPCPMASVFGWEIYGGFGGGGGGCSAGGGGGGYTGGNVSVLDTQELNGQGGLCYSHPNGTSVRIEPGASPGPGGEVEIAFVLDCPCEFMCIFKDYQNQLFKCYCAPNFVLADDGLTCIDPSDLIPLQTTRDIVSPVAMLCIAGAGIVVFVALLLYGAFCIISKRQKRHVMRLGHEKSNPDYQLDQLRSANTTSTMMTEYNPNYDFGDAKYTIHDLREIQRDKLSFVKALGQGAFGEVYQGFLSSMPEEPTTLPVAVKTLPALCTDQAEMDFLMEALIMSKFTHPNIVRFIGVCFEKHPRYIILELLEGGDLKTFLRESRPKPGHPSRVTMLDLVKLSLDVAKGCQHLEENRFIHRDIAARNCLLTTKDSHRIAKIADFGMARDIYRADYYRKGGKAMLPVKWMPPEAFLDGFFSSKTDVWSFGILLWEVFSMGYMPYPGCGNQEVMQLVTAGGRLEPPSNCPKPIYQIMKICSHGVPERRPNFATIIEKLQHCLQDPDVVHSPLPVFHHPAGVERHSSLSAPPSRYGTESMHSGSTYLEPDTPTSIQPLIGPQSPHVDISIEQETAFDNRKPETHGAPLTVFTYDSYDENEEVEPLEPLMNHIEPAGHVFEPATSAMQASPLNRNKHPVIASVNDKSFDSDALESDSFLPVHDSHSNCSNQASQSHGIPEYSNVNNPSASHPSDLENSLNVNREPLQCHSLPRPKTKKCSDTARNSANVSANRTANVSANRPASAQHLNTNASVQSLPDPQPSIVKALSASDTSNAGHLYVNTQLGNNKSMSALTHKSNQNALVQNELPTRSAVSLENNLAAAVDRQL